MSETRRPRLRMRIVPVLVAVTGFVAAVTFALSALGLFGFGHDGMRLAVEFAWMVPLGVDLLSIAAMVATYALRNSCTKRRVYAWTVFGFAVAASVAGNEAHAAERHLPAAGMVAAALPPLFLAAAVHMLIVVRRDLETVPPAAAPVPRPAAQPASTFPPPAGQTHPTARKEDKQVNAKRAAPALPGGQRRSGGGADPVKKVRALQLVDAGTTAPKAAKAVGVSPRTVQLWVQERHRRRLADQSRSADVTSGVGQTADTGQDVPSNRVNGHQVVAGTVI